MLKPSQFLYKRRCLSPEHEDDAPSMAVYSDHVFCFGCRFYAKRGTIDGRVFDVAHRVDAHRPGNQPGNVVVPARAVLEAWSRNLFAQRRAVARLKERGISEAVIQRMLVGYTGWQYSIPVWNAGSIATVRFRSDDDLEDKKFSGVTGRNDAMPYGVLGGLRVVVVEGEMDVLTVLSHGFNAVTMTNGAQALPKLLDQLGKWRGRLVLCADQDEPGRQAQYQLALRALLSRMVPVSVARFKEKDVGDAYREHGSKGVLSVIESATPVRCASDARRMLAA